jgi:hypothetical protein
VRRWMVVGLLQVAVQILTPVLAKYGFPIDQAGGMQFLAAACQHKQDPAVVAKAQGIKAKFIPPELAPLAAMFMGAAQGGGGMPMPMPQ